jgi:Tol biopolymer transport system component
MRANGKDKRQVPADINRNQGADWSPDGRLIVYRSGDALKIIRPDGTLVRLIANGGKDPVWSPNGQWIAYRTVTHIELVSRDGSTTRSVPRFWGQGHLRNFAWQPLPQ